MTNPDLLTKSYSYELPEELIAQRPTAKRDSCKLLTYLESSNKIIDENFESILEQLEPATTLVFNHSKVVPSRLFGKKSTGGACEILILDPIANPEKVPCYFRSNGKKRIGGTIQFEGGLKGEVIDRNEQVFFFKFETNDLLATLIEIGFIPIPPYIREGLSDEQDREDYQTVYAEKEGSIAAPTAGLHFTEELFEKIKAKGHQVAHVCLHVGAGTFASVKTDDIREHNMHTERYEVSQAEYEKIQNSKNVVAVGTTSLRVLESLHGKELKFEKSLSGEVVTRGETNIFLHPGVEVKSINGIITNFHLPESTLLMLVSALIGREKTLELYRHAVEQRYRFYSYGDAMFIKRSQSESV
jgi:S-adenosylmethionine:tRNA ribosyltransferase-isomerase